MALPEIKFENIRTHAGSQDAAFEELCCQLAALEPRASGATYRRKGRGGDAGLECSVERPDGSEIGWQAKYVPAWSSSLKSQLDESLDMALAKHPALVEYVVCLPFDLPDARSKSAKGKGQTKSQREHWEEWRSNRIVGAAKKKRPLAITLWGKSEISERLGRNDPAYSGRTLYWFDRELLTPAWFREQFEKARVSLGRRYTPETNVELTIRKTFLGLARDPLFLDEASTWHDQVQKAGFAAASALSRMKARGTKTRVKAVRVLVRDLGLKLRQLPTGPQEPYPVAEWMTALQEASRAVRKVVDWVYDQPIIKHENGLSDEEWARRQLYEFLSQLDDIQTDLESERWSTVNAQRVLLVGPGGIGKSHLLADIVETQALRDVPALMLLGSQFMDSDIWSQVLRILDLSPTLQAKHFLGALDAAAEATGMRALLCIDAINERYGVDIWPHRLPALLKDLEAFPRIAAVLSCRSTYVRHVIPSQLDEAYLPQIEHEGFATDDAATVYLSKRGIVRVGAPNLLPEFENPLFLRTCCDFLDKQGKRELPRGLRGVTSIFKFYNQAVADAVNSRMELDPYQRIVERALAQLADLYASKGVGYADRSEVTALFETILPSQQLLKRSLLPQLESEGVLSIEVVDDEDENEGEQVRFTFERFSDHAIATRLLDDHLNISDPASSFAVGQPLHDFIFGEGSSYLLGVVEAITIQLPERADIELLDAVPADSARWGLEDAFRESLLWRDQSKFTARTLEILKDAFDAKMVSSIMVSISTEPDNAFNAKYVHERLWPLEMPDRDVRWSTYLFQSWEEGEPVQTLVDWAFRHGFEEIAEDRAELAAIMLAWCFTTSRRDLRDCATKALAALLAPRLAITARLVSRFAGVNDPYVLERVLGAGYGAALQGMDEGNLSALAEATYRAVFAAGSPPVNIMIRDYAESILRYVGSRGKLPKTVDPQKIRPPYSSAWPIEHVPDELIESYTENYGRGDFRDQIVSSTVNDGDFARYVLDYLVDDWSPAPLGTAPLPTTEGVFQQWEAEFLPQATEAQKAAYEAVKAAAAVLKGDHTYHETPERKALHAADDQLRLALGGAAWEDYRVRAKDFVTYSMFARDRRDLPARFDTRWARRWVCKRAHDLGWTPKRFSEFERYNCRDSDRHDHRLERIGKKYQWLATYELVARMADHLAYRGSGYSDEPGLIFEEARQARLRNIDPSLLVVRTHYGGWAEYRRTWWVPFEPRLKSIPPRERLAWRDTDQDIINDKTLIDVRNPRDGRQWLVLDGFSSWNQHGIVDGESAMERSTWFRLNCIAVRKQNEKKLLKALKGRLRLSSSDLPQPGMGDKCFLGEYPWLPESSCYAGWQDPDDIIADLPVPVLPTVVEYFCERSGYDYSLEKSVKVALPAPWLVEALGLRLVDGKRLNYVDSQGVVRFFDPSVPEPGPTAALVDRDKFLAALEAQGLSAIWVIAGEKDVHGGGRYERGWGGSRSHTHVYQWNGEEFVCHPYFRTDEPSDKQLEALMNPRKRVRSQKPVRSKEA